MKGSLGRKVGPLPLWAWLVIAAAGIGAGVYLKRRLASSQNATQTAAPSSTAIPDTTGQTGALGTSGTSGSGDSTGGISPVNPYVPIFFGGGSDQQTLDALAASTAASNAAAAAFGQIGTSGASAGSTTNTTTNNYYTTPQIDPKKPPNPNPAKTPAQQAVAGLSPALTKAINTPTTQTSFPILPLTNNQPLGSGTAKAPALITTAKGTPHPAKPISAYSEKSKAPVH